MSDQTYVLEYRETPDAPPRWLTRARLDGLLLWTPWPSCAKMASRDYHMAAMALARRYNRDAILSVYRVYTADQLPQPDND